MELIFMFAPMFKFSKIREYENLHILLWLLKDTCWVLLWETGGIIMIIPTIAVAFHITWLSRHEASELFHNLAVVFWICANSVWMIGEFYFDDTLRPVSTAFFIAGLFAILFYYAVLLPRKKRAEKN